MRYINLILTISLVFLLFSGCNIEKEETTHINKKTLKIAGSTSVAPLMKELKNTFDDYDDSFKIEIQGSGSSSGISATIAGASQIGMSSRELKQKEKEQGLKDSVMALDGIAIILNNKNIVKDLTQQQITEIFKGNIKNWSEVGGEDGKILVVSREEGSGTRTAFDEIMGLSEPIEKNGKKLTRSLVDDDAYFETSTGAVKTNVGMIKNAIGYISYGTLDDSIKVPTVSSVACNEENIKNKTYPISREFIVCTMGEPDADAKSFLDFVFSDIGQAVVSDNNYIPIN